MLTDIMLLSKSCCKIIKAFRKDLKKAGYGFATLLNILSERSKLAREKQLREEVEREKAALEARLIQYQEEVSLYVTFLQCY